MRKRNTFLKTYGVFGMDEEYNALIGDNQKNLKDYEKLTGTTEMKVKASALVQSTDVDDGEIREILVIIADDGTSWASISPTFVDGFVTTADWLETKGMQIDTISVETRQGKKGRDFLSCVMKSSRAKESN